MNRIGIDVGGTNTDAVLLRERRVVSATKVLSTADITSGILAALANILEQADVQRNEIDGVMIGTTHFINAVIEGRSLSRTAAVRIGLPASESLPPFVDWPDGLADRVNGGVYMVSGGLDYDGRPMMPLDETGLEQIGQQIVASGVTSIAISAIFSPLDPTDEIRAAEILRAVSPNLRITPSHTLGRIGLLERENAAILNAALTDLAEHTISGFEQALRSSGITAPLYITQNDGTIMPALYAKQHPILSFSSGATNSMRGAAALSGLKHGMVVDVGGTTTDIGALHNGFPREANGAVSIGGVRTLFRMPDLLSIGLGGGSHVDRLGDKPGHVQVGPLSVGYRLTSEALIFGGDRLTTSDIAAAAGRLALGDQEQVAAIEPDLIKETEVAIQAMLAEALDSMKLEAGAVTLLAVGGGAFLVPETLSGVDQVIRVEYGDVANAVGAAIAQISGEVDQVFQGMGREAALEAAERIAIERAIAAGAGRDTVQVVDVEDTPIAYLPGDARRVRTRVVGDLSLN